MKNPATLQALRTDIFFYHTTFWMFKFNYKEIYISHVYIKHPTVVYTTRIRKYKFIIGPLEFIPKNYVGIADGTIFPYHKCDIVIMHATKHISYYKK